MEVKFRAVMHICLCVSVVFDDILFMEVNFCCLRSLKAVYGCRRWMVPFRDFAPRRSFMALEWTEALLASPTFGRGEFHGIRSDVLFLLGRVPVKISSTVILFLMP